MKKMTITIAICTALFLVACGKTNDTESTDTTGSMNEQDNATLSEQQAIPADQTVESATGTSTPSDQAAFEAGDSGDTTQGGQQ
jgi:major membrane immunogen (membrane-anchored lipoprotein)